MSKVLADLFQLVSNIKDANGRFCILFYCKVFKILCSLCVNILFCDQVHFSGFCRPSVMALPLLDSAVIEVFYSLAACAVRWLIGGRKTKAITAYSGVGEGMRQNGILVPLVPMIKYSNRSTLKGKGLLCLSAEDTVHHGQK